MTTINITGRHMKITEELKDQAHRQAEKLTHYYDRVKRIDIILSFNKSRYTVEMILSAARGVRLFG